MRVLLTGATGMVGRNFLRWARKHIAPFPSITALGRRAVAIESVEDVVVGDLSYEALAAALEGRRFDVIFHLMAAGVHPSERELDLLTRINSFVVPDIVKVARDCGAGAVVLAGSSAEYVGASGEGRLAETTPLETRRLYGASKAIGGSLGLMFGTTLGIPVAVARIFNVYGPFEAPHRLLPSLIDKLERGEAVSLSVGTQVRDFIYVDDVCRGLWRMALALRGGDLDAGAYNLCTGIGTTVADFARTVAHAGGFDERLLHFGAIPMRSDDLPRLVGDPGLIAERLAWTPDIGVSAGVTFALDEMSGRRKS